jgi:hypothetical protein
MDTEKKFRIAFVVICLSFLWTLIRLELYREKNQDLKTQVTTLKSNIDSLQIVSDSLYSENFPCQIELGRYQVAYQIFMERNPRAASQYGDIISEETE